MQSNGILDSSLNGSQDNSTISPTNIYKIKSLITNNCNKTENTRIFLSNYDYDIVRLIGQYFKNLGLKKTIQQLVEETNCQIEHPSAETFQDQVLSGNWVKIMVALDELHHILQPKNTKTIKKIKFLLLEQKFFELLEDERPLDAIYCLRYELSPLKYNMKRLHELARLIMCPDIEDLRSKTFCNAKDPNARMKVMDKIQNYLPPELMLAPNRLVYLLNQAIKYQINSCPYHLASFHRAGCAKSPPHSSNILLRDCEDASFSSLSLPTPSHPISLTSLHHYYSLLYDHHCNKKTLPCETKQILNVHTDEVWFCRFSNKGKFLASGSRDYSLIIWEVDFDTHHLSHKHTFHSDSFSVSYIAWSPDDAYIIACGPDDCCELWIWEINTGKLKLKMRHSPEDSLTSASWHYDSQKFVTGGTRGQFYLCDLSGNILESWEGLRVQCIWNLMDNTTTLASDTHHRIRSYDFFTKKDSHVIQEDHHILSFTCCKNDKYAILNVATQGVHLWDLQYKVLVCKFKGVTQGFYTIHSTFGGPNQDFVASGSEDNKVYIWHINKPDPISVLSGHSRTVNCVSWNPIISDMLVSASDDSTLRVWGPSNAHTNSDSNSNSESEIII